MHKIFIDLPFKAFLLSGDENTDFDIMDCENQVESVFTKPACDHQEKELHIHGHNQRSGLANM